MRQGADTRRYIFTIARKYGRGGGYARGANRSHFIAGIYIAAHKDGRAGDVRTHSLFIDICNVARKTGRFGG